MLNCSEVFLSDLTDWLDLLSPSKSIAIIVHVIVVLQSCPPLWLRQSNVDRTTLETTVQIILMWNWTVHSQLHIELGVMYPSQYTMILSCISAMVNNGSIPTFNSLVFVFLLKCSYTDIGERHTFHNSLKCTQLMSNTSHNLTSLTTTFTAWSCFSSYKHTNTEPILSQTVPNERCFCVHRRHHSDHHTQLGCQRHCVDENLERRNHYLDLAGIENYTSRFGAGEWTRARGVKKGRRKGETADSCPLKLDSDSSLLWHLLGTFRLNYCPIAKINIWVQTSTIHQVLKGPSRGLEVKYYV